MLRYSLVAALALVLLESAPAAADSFWTHNGSEMRLRADGSSRTFLYERPRAGIAAEGVEPGTVLFQGSATESESELSAGDYSGTAFIFSARCGKRSYEVSGSISIDMRGLFIGLGGKAPRIDRSTCQLKGTKESTLDFKFVRSDEPSRTDLPMAKVPNCRPTGDPDGAFDEYKACLEKEANRICRDTPELEELVRCFEDAMALIYKKSGMTGYATDFVEGAMNPFTHARVGFVEGQEGGRHMPKCVSMLVAFANVRGSSQKSAAMKSLAHCGSAERCAQRHHSWRDLILRRVSSLHDSPGRSKPTDRYQMAKSPACGRHPTRRYFRYCLRLDADWGVTRSCCQVASKFRISHYPSFCS